MAAALPPEFDAGIYRDIHADLRAAGFDDAGLLGHYLRHGRDEGRGCSSIRKQADFMSLIPADAAVLEICPGLTPALSGKNVKYYDTDSQDELISMAQQLNVSTAAIPAIDFVSADDDMSVVAGAYDVLLSVHNLTRHANLISHLQQCERLLASEGMMFCILPDKRYTYDHFTPETSLATLLARHHHGDNNIHTEHKLAALATSTHHYGARHWTGAHGSAEFQLEARVKNVLSNHREIPARHVNASVFTSHSFRSVMSSLQKSGLTSLGIHRLYPSIYGNHEFYVILKVG